MSYATNQYMPAHAQYYPTSTVNHQVHIVAPNARPEPIQRKRPKYTRSKTGCMTCRVKKIKCDETKPSCMRCSHGSRECTWPEGVPARKKPVRKDSIDGRPSTASSSVSDPSSPQTREATPPSSRLESELMIHHSRTSTDSTFLHMPPMHMDYDSRRASERSSYGPAPTSNIMPLMPENPYHTSRYDHSSYLGSNHHHSNSHRQPIQNNYRGMPSGPWSASPEPLDSYYGSTLQDRTALTHGPPHDHHSHSHHTRYQ